MQNPFIRKARAEVRTHGRILADTASQLMALGYDVPALEARLLAHMEFAG